MAFPIVADADTKNGVVTVDTLSWTLTYPTNLVSGDLVLALAASAGSVAGSIAGTGWVKVIDDARFSAVTLYAFMKPSLGTETGTFALDLNSAVQGGWRVFRITGWYGGTIAEGPGSTNGDSTSGGDVSGTSANPDPPSRAPTNWSGEDTLWFAFAGIATSRTISVFPASYTNTASDVSGGALGATLGTCSRALTAASEDPGTFTISASDSWVAATIAIRPKPTPTMIFVSG